MARLSRFVLLFGLMVVPPMSSAGAEAPRVVATIKPIHALASRLLAGIAAPALLIDGAASPHSYAMKPSDALALGDADIVFWVGPDLESFLVKPMESLADDARVLALADSPGVTLLASRAGGVWEADRHDDAEAHDHEDEGEPHNDGHEHEHPGDHEDESEHGHGAYDMHIWLDPRQASAMAAAMTDALATSDPDNAARYRANFEMLRDDIAALDRRIAEQVASVRDVPYIVFHDAYQYFEARYRLAGAGSVTLSPENAPGARRVYEIRRIVLDRGARCVFAEPQFEPAIVRTIVDGTDARVGILDPLGADVPAGDDAYFVLMERLAASFHDCLARP